MHDDMTATAREAEQHLGQGVKLLYNADRSQVFKASAPAATKEFSKSLEALLAHEARNPELYNIPAITAGMVEFRARAYKERATSYLIQGHLELYVRDWEKVLEIVEELRPKLAAALADPATDDEWIESLKAVDASVVAMQGDANGALGLHYLMIGDRSTAESYLGRALEVLPADDAKRENIEQILKATAPAE